MDGQVQLLKGAEEDQLEQQVIWAYGFLGGLAPVGRRWQVKKGWGLAYQQSLKGT